MQLHCPDQGFSELLWEAVTSGIVGLLRHRDIGTTNRAMDDAIKTYQAVLMARKNYKITDTPHFSFPTSNYSYIEFLHSTKIFSLLEAKIV